MTKNVNFEKDVMYGVPLFAKPMNQSVKAQQIFSNGAGGILTVKKTTDIARSISNDQIERGNKENKSNSLPPVSQDDIFIV